MGLQVALQQQQEMMCEMKSSCPVPRGSVQHTEQGWGWGGGCRGAQSREGPQPCVGTLIAGLLCSVGLCPSCRASGKGALGPGVPSSWRLAGTQPCRIKPSVPPCCGAPAPCARHPSLLAGFPLLRGDN